MRVGFISVAFSVSLAESCSAAAQTASSFHRSKFFDTCFLLSLITKSSGGRDSRTTPLPELLVPLVETKSTTRVRRANHSQDNSEGRLSVDQRAREVCAIQITPSRCSQGMRIVSVFRGSHLAGRQYLCSAVAACVVGYSRTPASRRPATPAKVLDPFNEHESDSGPFPCLSVRSAT